MEITSEKKFKRVSSSTELVAESSVDYTLPDYLTDVRKILYTECEARPAASFEDEGKVEFSGIVIYNVVYLDNDGKPTGVSFSSDYDATVKCPTEGLVGAYANPAVSSYNVRLTGPRRFTAKSTVSSCCDVVSEEIIAATGTAFDEGEEPETLTRVMDFRSVMTSERLEREYAEVIDRIEGGIADEIEIIYSGAEVIIDSATVGEESVSLKGELHVYAAVSYPDSPLSFIEKSIAVDETVPFAGVANDMAFVPEGSVVSLVTKVNQDETGAEIVASAVVEYLVRAEYNESVSAISDAFVKKCPTENTYSDYNYTQLVECMGLSSVESFETDIESLGCESLHSIIYLVATPKIERAYVDDNNVRVEGEVRFHGIGTEVAEDGEVTYTAIKFAQPLDKTLKRTSVSSSSAIIEATAKPTLASALINSDKLEVSYKLCGNMTLCERKNITLLATSDVIAEQAYEQTSGRITVYYPEPGETLFDVARKFHKSKQALAEDNNISAAAISDGKEATLDGVGRIYIF